MPFVLTVDQIDSRHGPDRVDQAIAELADVATLVAFTRTVGDEFQGVVGDPTSVLDAILRLMRVGTWHIGLGIGVVAEPLPADPRSGRGPAFVAARSAVEGAKSAPHHLRVVSPAPEPANDVEVVLSLLAALREQRTGPGWAAVDLVETGLTQAEAAARLGVSRQAIGQRVRAAHLVEEQAARPVLVRLLARADEVAVAQS